MATFLGKLLAVGPAIAPWAVFTIASAAFLFPRFRIGSLRRTFLALAWVVVAGRLGYALAASALQFHLWSNGNSIAQSFLRLPASMKAPTLLSFLPFLDQGPLGYFFVYSWGRFWLNPLLAILAAFTFYAFLRLLRSYNGRFFEPGEIELGLFAALLSGWPHVLVFLPLAFFAVLVLSLFRVVALEEARTTLGASLMLGLTAVLFAGDALVAVLGFGVLAV